MSTHKIKGLKSPNYSKQVTEIPLDGRKDQRKLGGFGHAFSLSISRNFKELKNKKYRGTVLQYS